MLILGVVLALVVLTADLMAAPSTAASSDHTGHGTETVSPAHSSISIAFALMGPVVVLAGLILSSPESTRSLKALGLVAGLTLLYIDGLLHWLAVLEHLGESSSAAFFIVSGAVQVGTVPLVRHRERLLWWIGVALTVFFIELYVITRIVPPPFSLEPESVESLGTISKGVEFAILVALGIFFGPRMLPVRLTGAIVNRRSLAFLFLGVLASLITMNLESYLYWWLLTVRAFVFTDFLLIGLTAFVGLAYYLRTGILIGMAWSFTAMVIIIHVIFIINYANAALLLPLLLCVVSGGLLLASMLTYRGRNTTVGNVFSLRVQG